MTDLKQHVVCLNISMSSPALNPTRSSQDLDPVLGTKQCCGTSLSSTVIEDQCDLTMFEQPKVVQQFKCISPWFQRLQWWTLLFTTILEKWLLSCIAVCRTANTLEKDRFKKCSKNSLQLSSTTHRSSHVFFSTGLHESSVVPDVCELVLGVLRPGVAGQA